MFELFRSRDKAVRYLLTALLCMVALSMITYLIPGGGSSSSNSPDPVIAEVGGEPITYREVMVGLQGAMRDKTFPPEMVQNYVPEFVNQMISERAMAYQAKSMGFIITDEDLAESIRAMLPQVFQGGQLNADAYRGFLQQQGYTVADFEANVRKQMMLTRLRNLALEGMIVTPNEVEEEFRRRKESAKVDYFVFSPEKFRPQVSVSAAEVQTYFNANRAQFKRSERRNVDLMVVDAAKVAVGFQVTEADARAAYDGAKERFRTPDRVKVRHILLMTTSKKPEELPAIENKAKDLLKQIKSGADFAELAKKNSEDPGSAAKGGEYDWIVRGQTVANFERAAFTMKPKEISDIVKTEYGLHIIQTLEKEDAHLRPFDDVKAQLIEERKKNGLQERVQLNAEQLHAALVKSPDQAAQLAQKFSATYYPANAVGAGEPLPEIGVNAEMGESISSLQKNGVSPVVNAPGGKLAVAVLTSITPPRPSELNEVEASIRERLAIDKSTALALEKLKEVTAQIPSAGGDLKKLAALAKADVKTTPEFRRDGAVEGIGSAIYLVDAFSKPIGTVIGPITVMGQTVVAKVAAQVAADMSQLPPERDAIITSIKQRKSRIRQDLFQDGVVANLIKTGKIKINKDAVNKVKAAFRSS